jgi:hypothetical protein
MGLCTVLIKTSVENPFVGGSIPPQVTKKHQNQFRIVFSLFAMSTLGR